VIDQTSLYRHFSKDDSLLYIGISLSALNRLGQHSSNSHWYTKISKVTIEHFDTRTAAMAAEREAIILEKPAHNIQHVGGSIFEKEATKCIEVAEKVLGARDEFITRIVNIKLMYGSAELANELQIPHKALKALIDTGQLGYVKSMGEYDKVDRRKFMISGWQVIDYMESISTRSSHEKNN